MFVAILNTKCHYTLHEMGLHFTVLLKIRLKGVINTVDMDMQASDTSILILMYCVKNQENLLQNLCSDSCLNIKFVISHPNAMCTIYRD